MKTKNHQTMKKNFFTLLSASLMLTFALSSCGGGQQSAQQEQATKEETAVVEQVSPEKDFALGEKIFNEKCIACHQANGQGIPGAFPSLVDSDLLRNDKLAAINQVLNGAPGGSIIKGVQYNAPMPHQVDTHEEAVAVINYVANHFGNDLGYISLEEAKKVAINPR
ncbi:MAG: cytochrome c [Bacteroidetes bacterium]|nr:cytochrome c [Bacteroidota bacterium]